MRAKTGTQQAESTKEQALQERVDRLVRRGMSEDAILRRLMRAGWAKSAIKSALKKASGKQTTRMLRWGLAIAVVVVLGYFAYPWIAGLFGS